MSDLRAALIVGFLAWFVSFFLYAPPFWLQQQGGGPLPSRIDDFIILCRDPFARNLHWPMLAYRITTPMLAWLLGLRGFSGVILQYMAIVASLALVFHVLARRTSRPLALVVTVGIACSYTIIWTDTRPGFPDAVTHLAVAVALCAPNPFLAAAMTFLGTLNDERFVLSIPFILLWHAGNGGLGLIWGRTWKLILGFAAGLAGVVFIRHALTVGWIGPGIQMPLVYRQMASAEQAWRPFEGWRAYLLNVPLAYRALWLLPLFFLAQRPAQPLGWIKFLYLGGLLATLLASSAVGDVSRSIGFAYAALLIAAWHCYETDARRAFQICAISLVLCLVLPAFHLVDYGGVFWQRPLVLSLLRAWTGWDVLQLFHHAART